MRKKSKPALLLATAVAIAGMVFCGESVYCDGNEKSLCPPSPEVYGQYNERVRDSISKNLAPPLFKTERSVPAPKPERAVTGTKKVLIILLEFSDVTHSASNTASYYNNLYFSTTPGNKSMSNYYAENSYNQLTVTGAVSASWHRSSNSMSYYGRDSSYGIDDANGPVYRLVTDAVNLANNEIDFSQYDSDNDGFVDHLCIVHAGEGQENSSNTDAIWSHRWVDMDYPVVDGKKIGGYTTVSEFSPMGVVAHEFGHDIGLPDLYDIDYSSYGVGKWCLMGSGGWNGGGATPAHLSAWCKLQLGWINPITLTPSSTGQMISNIEANKTSALYKYSISGTEYFLMENRQLTGFDAALPGSGILIWHVDELVPDNSNDSRRKVDLEEADDWSSTGSPFNATDAFYRENKSSFGDGTNPNSKSYSGASSGFEVFNISSSALTMSFNGDIPLVSYLSYVLYDTGVNVNNNIDRGETGILTVRVQNTATVGANSVSAQLSTLDTSITISKSTVNYGSIPANSSSSGTDSFVFQAGSNFSVSGVVVFSLTISDTDNHTWNSQFSVGPGPLKYASHTLTDYPGGDGIVDAGERILIRINVANQGYQNAIYVTGRLKNEETKGGVIGLLSDSSSYGTIVYSDTKNSDTYFAMDVYDSYTKNVSIYLTLEITDTYGHKWTEKINITPGPVTLTAYYISDEGGDGIPDNEEEVSVSFEVKNEGVQALSEVKGELKALNESVVIGGKDVSFGTLPGGESVKSGDLGTFRISQSINEGSPVNFLLTTREKNGYSWDNYFNIQSAMKPPEITIIKPKEKDYGSADTILVADIEDKGSGIDTSSFVLLLNYGYYNPNGAFTYKNVALNRNNKIQKCRIEFKTSALLKNGKYSISLSLRDNVGNYRKKEINEFEVTDQMIVQKVVNYPNPCRDKTKFTYRLVSSVDEVSIEVYTLAGRKIKTITGAPTFAGYNEAEWDLINDFGETLGNGVYLYVIKFKKGNTETVEKSKMMVLK